MSEEKRRTATTGALDDAALRLNASESCCSCSGDEIDVYYPFNSCPHQKLRVWHLTYMRLLVFLAMCFTVHSMLSAQSTSSVADSLVYKQPGKVEVYRRGKYVKTYPISFSYPSSGRDSNIQGVMGFELTLDKGCNVANITFVNSLGVDFEEQIRKDVRQITHIYKSYKYQNCEKIIISDSLNFSL